MYPDTDTPLRGELFSPTVHGARNIPSWSVTPESHATRPEQVAEREGHVSVVDRTAEERRLVRIFYLFAAQQR